MKKVKLKKLYLKPISVDSYFMAIPFIDTEATNISRILWNKFKISQF